MYDCMKMESTWRRLNREISNCSRCKDIVKSRRKTVRGIGSPESKVMIVGLAPGRDGADLTGIPFTRDPSGELIDEMLSVAGLSKEQDVFITNLVKCNPKDAKSRNRPPSKEEIKNCFHHLKHELDYLKPRIIVTLGKAATQFILNIKINKMAQFHGKKISKEGILFFPFFHPGYVVRGAYNKDEYLKEFKVLGDLFHDLIEKESRLSRLDILLMLLEKASHGEKRGCIRGKTRLQKLLFLVQQEVKNRGYKIKYAFRPYLYGPYSRGLYTDVEWLKINDLVEVKTTFDEKIGLITDFAITEKGKKKLINVMDSNIYETITQTVKTVIEKYNQMNVAELVEFVHGEFPDYYLSQREKSKKIIDQKLDDFL